MSTAGESFPVVTTPGEVPEAAATGEKPAVMKLKTFGVPAEVIAKLVDEMGLETVAHLDVLSEDDLVSAGMKKIPAKGVIASLKDAKVAAADPAAAMSVSFDNLPAVPNDASWMDALRTGGVLKVDQSSVISIVRVVLAQKVGLYGIPGQLAKLMEEFADTNEDQIDPAFYKIRKQLTRRSYAEVFEAIDGLDGSYVTDERKKKVLGRVNDYLWPAITGFNETVQGWQDAYMRGFANPALMMQGLAAAIRGGAVPAAMLQQVPDTGGVRDAADALNDAANKVFAGTGVQIGAALGYEAMQVREMILDPRLPSLIGVPNREQMLKRLGVAVPATYTRLETNLTRFVLGIMQVKDQPSGNDEVLYLSSIAMLGTQIPWDQLGVSLNGKARRPRGIGEEPSFK